MASSANLRCDYQPGDEGTWLKDNMALFQKEEDEHNDNDVRDMLKEIHEREDLRKLIE